MPKASPMQVDFSNVDEPLQKPSGVTPPQVKGVPRDSKGRMLTPKQIRARARRRGARMNLMTDEERAHLYKKPVEQWDLQELAKGRPKNSKGHFSGQAPKWITADIHERAMDKYTAAVKSHMRSTTVDALGLLNELIGSQDVDDKGKPIVPASVKLDAAKFLIEHVIGKPTQVIQNDVSVKLQAILGQVMVNPAEIMTTQDGTKQQTYDIGHYPGMTMELAERPEDDQDFFFEDDDSDLDPHEG